MLKKIKYLLLFSSVLIPIFMEWFNWYLVYSLVEKNEQSTHSMIISQNSFSHLQYFFFVLAATVCKNSQEEVKEVTLIVL